jgi:hypothetical protein
MGITEIARTPRRAPAFLAALAAAALTFGLVSVSAPATAAPAHPAGAAGTVALSSGGVRFRADGHEWSLQVNADSNGTVTVSIGTAYLHGFEVHTWLFSHVPGHDYTFSQSAGKFSLDTGRSLSPIASLNLRFTATSRKAASCAKGSGTNFKGSLTGSVTLVTGLRRVKFHSARATFSGQNLLAVSRKCVAPVQCAGGAWIAGVPGSGSKTMAQGNTADPFGRLPFVVTVSRLASLSHPRGTVREDAALVKTSAPVFDSRAKSLTVQAPNASIVTGGAVLSHAAAVIPKTVSCVAGGKRHAEIIDQYFATAYSSRAGRVFTAHTLLTGNLSVKPSGIGTFLIVTKAS